MAPKKRGRPRKARDPEPGENPAEAPPRKRRKADQDGISQDEQGHEQGERSDKRNRSKGSVKARHEAAGSEKQNTEETTSHRSRRNRRPDDSTIQPVPEPEAADREAKTAKGKPGRKPTSRGDQPAESQGGADTSARRSQRDRRSADDKPWWAANQGSPKTAGASKEAPGAQKPKRGRPSLAEVSVSKAQNQAGPSQTELKQKGRRGRPPRVSNGPASPREVEQPSASKPQKGPPTKAPNRRRASEPEPSASPSSDVAPGPPANYHHLTTLTRQIPPLHHHLQMDPARHALHNSHIYPPH